MKLAPRSRLHTATNHHLTVPRYAREEDKEYSETTDICKLVLALLAFFLFFISLGKQKWMGHPGARLSIPLS